MQSMVEGSEQLTEVSQQDLRVCPQIFESAANQLETPLTIQRVMGGLIEQPEIHCYVLP